MASQEPYDHKCHLCSKSFTRSFNLRNHLNTHSGVKPFPCTFCGQSFTRNHDRRNHENEKHSCTKRYPCRNRLPTGEVWGCNSVFARKAILQRHLNSNIGRACRPHSNESSASASSLARPPVRTLANLQNLDFSDGTSTTLIATNARRHGSTDTANVDAGQVLPPFDIASSATMVPMKLLQHSPSMSDTDVILLQTKSCVMSCLAVRDSRKLDLSTLTVCRSEFQVLLPCALKLLDRGVPVVAWRLINEACEYAKTFLWQQPPTNILQLFLAFSSPEWTGFPGLRLNLLKYLTGMAQQVLAAHHPLTTILQLLQNEDALLNSAEPAIRLILDVTTEQTGPPKLKYRFEKYVLLSLKTQGNCGLGIETLQPHDYKRFCRTPYDILDTTPPSALDDVGGYVAVEGIAIL